MILLQLLVWLHLLCMVGAFGALLFAQLGLPADVRRQEAVARGISRVVNALIGAGLLAGAGLYGVKHGQAMGAHYNGVIGIKFGLLLAVGALVAMSRKPERGDALRTLACTLLAVAAFLGSSLIP
jgi:hypothetical protein